MRLNYVAITLTLGALLCATASGSVSAHKSISFHSSSIMSNDVVGSQQRVQGIPSLETILSLRGGAKKKRSRTATLTKSSKTVTGKNKVGDRLKADKKSKSGDLMQKYKDILPLTKVYVTMIMVCTVLGLILGEERAQALFSLDPMRFLYGGEIWRPLTAASFLGKPSIGWLMSGYYLYEYGSSLERAFGPAQHLVFLISQLGILTAFSILFRQPVFGTSMITAMLHVLSRATPNQKVKWLIFTVPFWSLPILSMVGDCLQAGNAAAALPHVLGILSGHYYHFHRFVWPKIGGQDWLVAPDFLIERMDPNAAKKSAAKESLAKALKSRKRGKGKKLGR
jgi:derlin-1